MDKKIKKFIKKIFWMVVISLVIYLFCWLNGNKIDKTQYLDSIDYQVTVNKDGSMNVVETWDININKTNL